MGTCLLPCPPQHLPRSPCVLSSLETAGPSRSLLPDFKHIKSESQPDAGAQALPQACVPSWGPWGRCRNRKTGLDPGHPALLSCSGFGNPAFCLSRQHPLNTAGRGGRAGGAPRKWWCPVLSYRCDPSSPPPPPSLQSSRGSDGRWREQAHLCPVPPAWPWVGHEEAEGLPGRLLYLEDLGHHS